MSSATILAKQSSSSSSNSRDDDPEYNEAFVHCVMNKTSPYYKIHLVEIIYEQ